MKNLIRFLNITTAKDAIHEMGKVGVDATGLKLMKGKALHYNFKIEGIEPRIANLLKQEMLSLGGDVALNRKGIDCSTRSTDAILMGTEKQFDKLILRLTQFPELQSIGVSLREAIKNILKNYFVLHCRKQTFLLGKRTLIMGVLNVTPDSFSDGGLYLNKERAVEHGLKMIEEGADMIDVGGESTRPGAKPLDINEELKRVLPVIETLSKRISIPISIDTYKSEVAQRAIDVGAEIINDISGLNFDPSIAEVAAREDIPIVLMHIRGTPETMQKDIHYDSIFSEIILYLRNSIHKAEKVGVNPKKIIIDPGIGFGKTVSDNLRIIKNLKEFQVLGKPILLGTSRKSFIGKILNAEPKDRIEGTLSSIAIGVLNGAHIIRTHDVLQAKRAIAIADAIRLSGN
ncbi:MAG: dihydropteroate synthase [Thermodesulfobacteriota bacterium]